MESLRDPQQLSKHLTKMKDMYDHLIAHGGDMDLKTYLITLSTDLKNALQHEKFDISINFQPVNSPYFNVLDLGFFNAIQSLQHQCAPKTVDDFDSMHYRVIL